MNKKVTQFSSVEELINHLEEYSGISIELEEVDTHEKLLSKISQIQENLLNEVLDMCSHYRYEAERLVQVNCILPELASKEESMEDEFSSYLKTKWRQLKSIAATVVVVIVVLVSLMLIAKLRDKGINAQINLYEETGIWLGR